MKGSVNKNAKAVIIFGPPGSGKGLQATILSLTKEFIHFDTGKYIESIVFDPHFRKDTIICRERKNFEDGKICTPDWVLKITSERIVQLGKAGTNIVLSGSPRTFYEAFNKKNPAGLFEIFPKYFKKQNIKIILLESPELTSINRNSMRKVCSVCRLPMIYPEN